MRTVINWTPVAERRIEELTLPRPRHLIVDRLLRVTMLQAIVEVPSPECILKGERPSALFG
jgi:hypothetical protein